MTGAKCTTDHQVPPESSAVARVVLLAMLGLTSWILAALAVTVLVQGNRALELTDTVRSAATSLLAGLAFGLLNRSGRLGWLRGALGGLLGALVASAVTPIIMFAGFSNPALAWLGNIAYLAILTTISSAVFGAVTVGVGSGGGFALVGISVAMPVAVVMQTMISGAPQDILRGWDLWAAFQTVTLGLAVGLATGLHRRQPTLSLTWLRT